MKAVPKCIKPQFTRILTQTLVGIEAAQKAFERGAAGNNARIQTWTLFLLLPRLLFHHTNHGGEAGERELKARIATFDAGAWDKLLQSARDTENKPFKVQAGIEARRLDKTQALIKVGELSHAARALDSNSLAPGTTATLDELRNPDLRPQRPAEPMPPALQDFQPPEHVNLDKDVFGTVLRQARRGLSAGKLGSRYEYFKVCLEEEAAFDALHAVAQRLARAQIPNIVARAMAVSSLTALTKPNNRVRGISSGDTFRRLVSKSLARQFQDVLRASVAPFNFGLSDRSGTDSAIHLLRCITDTRPDRVVLSIDGVGAFGHICRTRMFEQFLADPELSSLVPFVRQWYGSPTTFHWEDCRGHTHVIQQGDGGEQRDALMPALFCLALHPALLDIRATIPADAEIIVYLDDLYVVCGAADAAAILRRVRTVLEQVCHIDINIGKLKAWSKAAAPCPPGLHDFGDDIWKANGPIHERGLKILGPPLGAEEYAEQFATKLLADTEKLIKLIPKLPCLQHAWLLLYYCAVPRLNHLLRTTPPARVASAAQLHDDRILSIFQTIFSIPRSADWMDELHGIPFQTWVKQARLPLRLGGIGLRDSGRTAAAAYWASWADTIPNITARFPVHSQDITTHLQRLQNLRPRRPSQRTPMSSRSRIGRHTL